MNSVKTKAKKKLGCVAQIHILLFAVNMTVNLSNI